MFMHGGVSGGISSQGFPIIVQIINRLSEDFKISVYSLSPVEKNFNPSRYKVYAPPPSWKIQWTRWAYLVTIFILNHFRESYNILYSFWGYPVGFAVTLFGKIFRVPTYINILGAETANLPEIKYGHLRKPVSRKLVLWTCRNASILIAVSSYQESILKKFGVNRKIHIIPFGADTKRFYPVSKSASLPLKILHVANLTEVKNQETLLKAFELIRSRLPARLRIVGPDFLNGQIQQMTVDMSLDKDVEFIGPILQTEMLTHYHWADFFMLTSLSEGQNNALMEAMTCGVLPVSTLVGTMDDKLGHELGIVAPCRDYETLAEGVVSLFNMPEEFERKQKAAFVWANAHDFNWTISQLRALLFDGR